MKECYSLEYVPLGDPVVIRRTSHRVSGRTLFLSTGYQRVTAEDAVWYAAYMQYESVHSVSEDDIIRLIRKKSSEIPMPLVDNVESAMKYSESAMDLFCQNGYRWPGEAGAM